MVTKIINQVNLKVLKEGSQKLGEEVQAEGEAPVEVKEEATKKE
jgi:hypothetical protein